MSIGYMVERAISTFGIFFTRRNEIPVIYYHDIVQEGSEYSYMRLSISAFKQQMNFLKENGFRPILFSEVTDNFLKGKTDKSILITFDDGYLSNYRIVFPIMEQLSFKFNIFLAAGLIDKNPEFLTWDMVREMSHSNIVEFGAHTYNHLSAFQINQNNFDLEYKEANNIIENFTMKKVDDFCFPFGHYNKKVLSELHNSKVYKRIYTSDYKKVESVNGCSSIGRAGISARDTINVFNKKISGLYNGMYYYTKIRSLMRGLQK